MLTQVAEVLGAKDKDSSRVCFSGEPRTTIRQRRRVAVAHKLLEATICSSLWRVRSLLPSLARKVATPVLGRRT